MGKAKKKTPEKTSAVDRLRAKFGTEIVTVGEDTRRDYEVYSTGSFGLDRATGIGGFPRGRIVEIYGPEASGKTTLALHTIASCHRAGDTALLVDAEHAMDPQYASALGVDLERLLVVQPTTGEEALDAVVVAIEGGDVGCVVVDSVAALTPKAEIEGDVGDSHVGRQARLLGQALRKMTAVAARTNTLVVFINQLRMKIGVMFGSPETTPGGNAPKFFSSMRVDIRRRARVQEGDATVANETRAKLVKNKCAPPYQEAMFQIRYGQGIDSVAEVVELAIERGIVNKRGAWLDFDGDVKAQGVPRFIELARERPDLVEELKGRLVL